MQPAGGGLEHRDGAVLAVGGQHEAGPGGEGVRNALRGQPLRLVVGRPEADQRAASGVRRPDRAPRGGDRRQLLAGAHALEDFSGFRVQPHERVLGRPGRTRTSVRQQQHREQCHEHDRGRGRLEQPAQAGGPVQAERGARGLHQLRAGRVALRGILRERLRDHVLEARRPRRIRRQVVEEGGDGRVVGERRPAGQALVEQAAERVRVGAAVDVVALDLLRRDVVDRAGQLRLRRRRPPARRLVTPKSAR